MFERLAPYAFALSASGHGRSPSRLFCESAPSHAASTGLIWPKAGFESLDRLMPQQHASDFLPLGHGPFLAKQETRLQAVLRSRFGTSCAAAIAFGRSITIEAALGGLGEQTKETSHGDHRHVHQS
jgi:hypothetical protein